MNYAIIYRVHLIGNQERNNFTSQVELLTLGIRCYFAAVVADVI